MNILVFIMFGLVNGIIFHTLDEETKRKGIMSAILLGMLGALTGGMLAYALFGGASVTTTPIFSVIVVLEIFFLGVACIDKLWKHFHNISY